jgi:hypothetical protein
MLVEEQRERREKQEKNKRKTREKQIPVGLEGLGKSVRL